MTRFVIRIIFKPAYWLLKKFLPPLAIKVYHFFSLARRRLNIAWLPAKNRLNYFFVSRSGVYLVLFLITGSVIFFNFQARQVDARSFGANSLLATIVKPKTDDLLPQDFVTESGLPLPDYFEAPTAETVLTELGTDEDAFESTIFTLDATEDILIKPEISSTTEAGQLPFKQTDIYEVKEGDSLSTIAAQHGISLNTLLVANNLTLRSTIRPGQKLTILPVDGVEHIVRSGESFLGLSALYKTDVNKILAANNLSLRDTLKIGQKLLIPGARQVMSAGGRSTLAAVKDFFVPPSANVPPDTNLLWPTSGHVITQYYSWRHHAIDIDGDYSSPIYASADGVVEYAGWLGDYGRQIIVNHGDGLKTRYAHNSKNFVSTGDRVKQGQTIAMVGTTGRSTGTHIHYEVIQNGRLLNPLNFVR